MALEECLLGLSSKSVEGCHCEVRKPEGGFTQCAPFPAYQWFSVFFRGKWPSLCVRFFDFLVVVLG